ncbi:MAG: hypothetical protein JWN48_422 [Myxococcaceae bacterium]|nr:hypothetical protein [Myxococcaceae bacterium]
MRRCSTLPSLLLTLLLASCANIIDLEKRDVVVGDGGVTGVMEAVGCEKFCAEAMTQCTADRAVQDYSTMETCLGVCAAYSTDPSITGNTLACRQSQLDKLKAAGQLEAQTYCPSIAPGGGPGIGEAASSGCGTDCEGYCDLRAKTCPAQYVEPDCVRKCQALPSSGPYNADKNFGSGEDSLQCRIAHLSAAALYKLLGKPDDLNTHCSHSGIRSKVQCDVNDKAELRCEDVCKITMAACSGDAAVFESLEQCVAFCKPLPMGTMMDDNTINTRRCTRAGAYDALELGARLCPNAGPAPDRCGRGRCQAYCLLAQQGCPTQFATTYPSGAAQCESACEDLSGSFQNDPYSVTAMSAKTGNTLQCRLLRVTRALTGDTNPATCAEALGEGACKFVTP